MKSTAVTPAAGLALRARGVARYAKSVISNIAGESAVDAGRSMSPPRLLQSHGRHSASFDAGHSCSRTRSRQRLRNPEWTSARAPDQGWDYVAPDPRRERLTERCRCRSAAESLRYSQRYAASAPSIGTSLPAARRAVAGPLESPAAPRSHSRVCVA
jgi:hypothetical protein